MGCALEIFCHSGFRPSLPAPKSTAAAC